MNEFTLDALANRYKSDKYELGYMPIYMEYFQRQGLNILDTRNVLEIGTNKGSSLRVWAEFFVDAQVYGIDITRNYEVPSIITHPRIHTYLVNQGNQQELATFITNVLQGAKFDLIIDDGSHDQHDQQLSLSMLFGCLKSGGLYVIEDLITGENWWDANTYNKKRVRATRTIMQEFQQTNKLPEGFLNGKEIEIQTAYCEYRESGGDVFGHKPQIAFIGKK